jgi:hypothetical protein
MSKTLRPIGDGSLSIVVDSTMTVREFKANNNTEKLGIKPAKDKAGHFFMVSDTGKVLGPVSSKKDPKDLEHPVVSEFKGTPTEQNPSGFFFMLHERGEGVATYCEF